MKGFFLKQTPWCPLPWTHLSIDHAGLVRLCCQSRGDSPQLKNLQTDSIPKNPLNHPYFKRVRATFMEGKWPKECHRCQEETLLGKTSRNVFETKELPPSLSKETFLDQTEPDGSFPAKILTLDIRLGNNCNLKCPMCYAGESNLLYEDHYSINGPEFWIGKKKITLHRNETGAIELSEPIFDWTLDPKVFERLDQLSSDIYKIFIAGGEPLLSKVHQDFLSRLIKSNISKKISLEYNSNITVLPAKTLEQWTHFKNVDVGASLDGYGKINSEIRYPSNWSIIEKNLDLLDQLPENIQFHITTTISILNIEHIIEWFSWLARRNFSKIKKRDFSICSTHPVNYPKHLSVTLLSDTQADELFDWLHSIIPSDLSGRNKRFCTEQLNYFKKKAQLSFGSSDEPLKMRRHLKTHLNHLDKTRNQNWATISPILNKFIKEWDL